MYNTLDGQIYFYLLVKDKLFYDFFNFNLSFTIGKTKYSLKKNLVTGATGLVGTHIVLDLLKKGQAVRATCTPRSNKKIMEQVLDKKGNALFKVFDGEYSAEFFDFMKTKFIKTKRTKPKASRKPSSELYCICMGYL